MNAKSVNAAARLNDWFAAREWKRYFRAFPADSFDRVEIEYKSTAYGQRRVVSADPIKLQRWLETEGRRYGSLTEFEKILDRKAEATHTPQQGELELPKNDPVRRSMMP